MKKIKLSNIAAALLSAVAVIAVMAAIVVAVTSTKPHNRKNLPPPDRSEATESEAEHDTTTAPVTSSHETTTVPEATTALPATTEAITTTEATTTEAVTTTVTTTVATTPVTTTLVTTTTEAATIVTTTEATTVTTTVATTVKTTVATTTEPELGELGYDLGNSASTDKSKAKGDISKIIINEISPKNKTLKDADGEKPDWIELYNPTGDLVNLEGAGLSDDAEEPLKWVFPSVNIQPGGYLVVFCSDKDTKSPELHTSFKISSGNEQIIFSSKEGKVIDSVIVNSADDDETIGRYPNGSGTYKILTATPGKSNDKAESARDTGVAAPIFSAKSGFYESAFDISILSAEGTTVYYTTDGTNPTTNSSKYSGKITIKDRSTQRAVLTYKTGLTPDGNEQMPKREFEKATVIRAIAVDANGKKSAISSATYFVGAEAAKKYKNATVISVITDPGNLYSQKSGIFVAGDVFAEWRKKNPTASLDGASQGNYNQRGKDWERPAHIDFFRDGKLQFSENVGIRTHGGWSRASQQKSLKFYFRSEYGESKLKYKLFTDNKAYDNGKVLNEYKRFMIRNGGNDSFSLTYKDPWTQSLVRNFPFATQSSDVAICFIDGEYWGMYTMNEVYDDNYIEENYGVKAENAVMIKVAELEEGKDGDEKLWSDAVDFIKNNDMTKEDNYKKACDLLDMDSFCEYIAMETYIGNEDWLWNNWAAWRARETSDKKYEDGRWRFMCYDTEYSMNLYGNGGDYKYDILSSLAKGDGHLGPMFKSLLKSSEFKQRFVIAMEDVMNIAFNPDSASAQLDKYHKQYGQFIPQHFERFVFWQNLNGIAQNRDSWKNWLKNRYNYMPEQLNSVIGIGTTRTSNVTLEISDSKGGIIKINGIPITTTGGKWTGHYFTGYKISVEAVPAKGYKFTGWSGGYEGDAAKLTLNPNGALSMKANFAKTE